MGPKRPIERNFSNASYLALICKEFVPKEIRNREEIDRIRNKDGKLDYYNLINLFDSIEAFDIIEERKLGKNAWNPEGVAKIEFKNIKKLAYCFSKKAQDRVRLLIVLNEPCQCISKGNIVPSFFWLNE